MSRASLAASATALCALAAGLAGCGGSGGDAVTKAAKRTLSQGLRMEYVYRLDDGAELGDAASVRGAGVFNADESGRVTLDQSDAIRVVHGSADPHGVALFRREDGRQISYVHFDALDGSLPDGKSWLRLDLDAPSRVDGTDFETMTASTPTAPPEAALRELLETRDVRRVGDDTIGGVRAAHYRVTIDLRRVAARRPQARALARLEEQLTRSRTERADVWLDGGGRVLRFRVGYRFYGHALEPRLHLQITMTFSDFGAHAQVRAPTPDGVLDLTRLPDTSRTAPPQA